jgi:hypothetical protein
MILFIKNKRLKMRERINLLRVLITFLLLAAIALVGCGEKKTETEKKQDVVKKTEVQKLKKIPPKKSTQKKNPVVVPTIPDITGNWTGTFDGRSAFLTITEQTDSSFAGKVTINYRQQINQVVKGSFSPATMNMSMSDQTHSRFMGKYDGKLSNEASVYSGHFIMNVDGSKLSFNFKKK